MVYKKGFNYFIIVHGNVYPVKTPISSKKSAKQSINGGERQHLSQVSHEGSFSNIVDMFSSVWFLVIWVFFFTLWMNKKPGLPNSKKKSYFSLYRSTSCSLLYILMNVYILILLYILMTVNFCSVFTVLHITEVLGL